MRPPTRPGEAIGAVIRHTGPPWRGYRIEPGSVVGADGHAKRTERIGELRRRAWPNDWASDAGLPGAPGEGQLGRRAALLAA